MKVSEIKITNEEIKEALSKFDYREKIDKHNLSCQNVRIESALKDENIDIDIEINVYFDYDVDTEENTLVSSVCAEMEAFWGGEEVELRYDSNYIEMLCELVRADMNRAFFDAL